MRTPFRWPLTSRTSLHALCACCALWGVPCAALAAPEQIAPVTVQSAVAPAASTSVAHDSAAQIGGFSVDKRILTLLAMGLFIGLVVGWASGGPRETHFRLFNKPRKTSLPVLVPPGPTPRLIPSDSPYATRARSTHAPIPRQTPAGARPGVDYIAAFAEPAETIDDAQVDFLLESSDSSGTADSVEVSVELPADFDTTFRKTG